MNMNLNVFFASFINLLVALAVPAANADNPITKLKVGKFFLECKGDCSDKFSFQDDGFLTFGTDKQVITNKDQNSIYTYHIINDFPEDRIPQFCIDGSPDLKIGRKIYKHKKVNNTFPFFDKNPTSIGIYTSTWGATGWGSSTVHIFDTKTGNYFTETASSCNYPKFMALDNGVEYYVNYEFKGFFGPPNFSLAYIDFPYEAKTLKGDLLNDKLLSAYGYLYDEYMKKGWFSDREFNELERLFNYWEQNDFIGDVSLFDQSEQEILSRFIVAIGYDMLHKNGLPKFKEYFNQIQNSKSNTNAVKEVANMVANEFSDYFGKNTYIRFSTRYEVY